MGFMKEISDSMLKVGDILITKTETFTQSARLRIEIRKRELEIEHSKAETGDYVISRTELNQPIENEFIMQRIAIINRLKDEIKELAAKLEQVKSQNSNSSFTKPDSSKHCAQ